MKQALHAFSLQTTQPIEFCDVTEQVGAVLAASGVREGTLTVFSPHTTTAIKVNERCERLQQDMHDILARAVPSADYQHDEDTIDGRPNARGHLMSLFLTASETIPVSGGKLLLGDWQSIFFVELDGPRSERRVTVKIMGE
jgi:secondary thiamine-phosphate synthase enzyme